MFLSKHMVFHFHVSEPMTVYLQNTLDPWCFPPSGGGRGRQEHFEYFKRQALKQAEECAEKACLVWCDDRSLYRLGLARKLTAESAKAETFLVLKEATHRRVRDGWTLGTTVTLGPLLGENNWRRDYLKVV